MRVKYSLEDAAFEELRRSVVILSVIYKYMFNRKDTYSFNPAWMSLGILSHVRDFIPCSSHHT